jgi:hypothetical protein
MTPTNHIVNALSLALLAGVIAARAAPVTPKVDDPKALHAQIDQLQADLAKERTLNGAVVKGLRACQAQRNAAQDAALDAAMNTP